MFPHMDFGIYCFGMLYLWRSLCSEHIQVDSRCKGRRNIRKYMYKSQLHFFLDILRLIRMERDCKGVVGAQLVLEYIYYYIVLITNS